MRLFLARLRQSFVLGCMRSFLGRLRGGAAGCVLRSFWDGFAGGAPPLYPAFERGTLGSRRVRSSVTLGSSAPRAPRAAATCTRLDYPHAVAGDGLQTVCTRGEHWHPRWNGSGGRELARLAAAVGPGERSFPASRWNVPCATLTCLAQTRGRGAEPLRRSRPKNSVEHNPLPLRRSRPKNCAYTQARSSGEAVPKQPHPLTRSPSGEAVPKTAHTPTRSPPAKPSQKLRRTLPAAPLAKPCQNSHIHPRAIKANLAYESIHAVVKYQAPY